MKISRRHFLASAGAGALALLAGCGKDPRPFSGRIIGASSNAAHRLRDGTFPAPVDTVKTKGVIVGGGIAGLAAARRLDKKGLRDFILLDLEPNPGGNSSSGSNSISAYPWGAHYVPLQNEESTEVISLFEELGIIRGRNDSGVLVYDEESLCSDPMERLLDSGRWQDGFLPQIGISTIDRQNYDAFFKLMDDFRNQRGTDGRPAFAIPLDLSSHDPEFLALDRLTMSDWMTQHDLHSEPLRWYVNYCCRDDYGAGMEKISAWAGIHYFASRRGRAANAEHDAVVTWPEGNGWLVRQLAEPHGKKIQTGCIAWNIESTASGGIVDYFNFAHEKSHRIEAEAVICCVPRFVRQRIIRNLPAAELGEYSPWVVSNITLNGLPSGNGVPLAWDNVSRKSDSLGYVVATHQGISLVPIKTVLTHYWPLDWAQPRDVRQIVVTRTHSQWCDLIVGDLERMHPGISNVISNIDVWVWGHGMIRPVPGYIWGTQRPKSAQSFNRIVFAHSDMSGISIFEEAYTRGVQAAENILTQLS